MKKIIIAISMMLAMNIFLAVPALAENYQEYGLYDSDGNYKGMFYSIEEINDFLENCWKLIEQRNWIERRITIGG